ncbi:hypothetical protein DNTS_003939 [Danionella cerebrum]|uniref:CUB domain-containing protein n=1 Tax=Danionella cerebrum TaxID=2873325 RepID=A0A553QBS9_9TELE|nr:hypothetical protein DNTS_003939 [Danionella translucida]TRY87366.1 hypothetical protein DNTS_003939 [Danionella translucida]
MGSSAVPVLMGLILLQNLQISVQEVQAFKWEGLETNKREELLTNREELLNIGGCDEIEVTPDPDTMVIFSKKPGAAADCSVCREDDSSQTCSSELRLIETKPHRLTFNCSEPGDVFTAEINQEIECTSFPCPYKVVHPDSTRFLEFSRTFTWDLKTLPGSMFQLDFPSSGMKQIKPSESCPDKHTYQIITYQREGPTTIGTFCRNGSISEIQVRYRGRVSLEVAKGTALEPSSFQLSPGPPSTGLVEVTMKLPRTESTTDFFSPNFETGFYTEDRFKWNFVVEPMLNFTVSVKKYRPPECLKKEGITVDYVLGEKTTFTKKLTDAQPVNQQGDFSLTLNSYLCSVDLRNEEGLSLEIVNKNLDSFCEMSLNSVVLEKIVMPAGTKADLSFLDCPFQDLQLTGTKTIGKGRTHTNWAGREWGLHVDLGSGSGRSVAETSLTIPSLDPSLPMPLDRLSWVLKVPAQGALELSHPSKPLHQSVPDGECEESVSMLISELAGSSIGHFCSTSKGAIQKIQIRGDTSVTVTPKSVKGLDPELGVILKVTTNPEMNENVVFTVSPLVLGSTYLSSPNWPDAMNPSSSAAWIINLPSEHKAELQIINYTKPECSAGQAQITSRPLDSTGPPQTWKEDQSFPSQFQSFYLAVSSCEAKSGGLALLSRITLQKESKKLLGIILAVVGGILALAIIALIVVCVIRKRKSNMSSNRSSIYFPKGKPVLPGHATFPKSRTDNESHEYASIGDPSLFGHVQDKNPLPDSDWSNGHPVDTYRPFTGPIGSTPPEDSADFSLNRRDRRSERDAYQPFLSPPNTFNLPRPRSPLISQGSLGFEDRRMMDNELNTFKGAGDMNPIRLSSDESRLRPQVDSDSENEETI